jgi:hypothetical protein
VKSRQKNGRDSRSRETEVGEKIAVTNVYKITCHVERPILKKRFDVEIVHNTQNCLINH